ncbi:YhcH/YjgK/YiaL family protein [Paenibacillus chondroitinus]|uniref:YhcH/YjgK/YiaL family protein n=1 Tax=Paenibacillus chondroitinus TaxID=59842 RepID=A0ABU6DG67_9BACL|nr:MULTISPECIES: YhcH/YjgK/YiaL family protein [Paenibacillus]MCY9663332.1 YhcH/YjgK/YiaL family protein [Paenibacillus anseongense]MEB4796744.1 YhcH/YjgK/YiaL family protein [Paenibacillus chondroitinus]
MIISDLKHFEQERHLWPAAIGRGIDYILSRNLGEAEAGRYDLEGDNGHLMFANVQEVVTRPAEEQLPESHVVYTDIQFLVSGEEKLCFYKVHPDAKLIDNKFETHDVAFYETDPAQLETGILLTPGMFAVCFPSDIHRPNCSITEASANKKIVVKVHKDLLQL